MPIKIDKPIALVGLMGVGKTTVGRRLAAKLNLPFYDSDEEIESASRRTVAGYFKDHGEAAFREGECRVITRLLKGQTIILGTGGGAFIYPDTQKVLLKNSITVWLKGDFDTLYERVRRKDTRPLLKVDNPKAAYRKLMDERYPVYAKADITVNIAKGPHIRTVNRVIKALDLHLNPNAEQAHKNRRPPRRRIHRTEESSIKTKAANITQDKAQPIDAHKPKAGA